MVDREGSKVVYKVDKVVVSKYSGLGQGGDDDDDGLQVVDEGGSWWWRKKERSMLW